MLSTLKNAENNEINHYWENEYQIDHFCPEQKINTTNKWGLTEMKRFINVIFLKRAEKGVFVIWLVFDIIEGRYEIIVSAYLNGSTIFDKD
jgi:hypothetical protein